MINGIADETIMKVIDGIIQNKDLSLIPNIMIKKDNEIILTEKIRLLISLTYLIILTEV